MYVMELFLTPAEAIGIAPAKESQSRQEASQRRWQEDQGQSIRRPTS